MARMSPAIGRLMGQFLSSAGGHGGTHHITGGAVNGVKPSRPSNDQL
jgi:hypothetical protein